MRWWRRWWKQGFPAVNFTLTFTLNFLLGARRGPWTWRRDVLFWPLSKPLPGGAQEIWQRGQENSPQVMSLDWASWIYVMLCKKTSEASVIDALRLRPSLDDNWATVSHAHISRHQAGRKRSRGCHFVPCTFLPLNHFLEVWPFSSMPSQMSRTSSTIWDSSSSLLLSDAQINTEPDWALKFLWQDTAQQPNIT